MYRPKYFRLYEWFPKDFYNANVKKHGEGLWRLIDNRILWTFDQLRERYGTVVVNDWWWRSDSTMHQYRGFRPAGTDVGAKFSQHKFGRAGDCKFKNVSAEEVRQAIKDDPFSNEFKFITCLEDDVSWLHIDCRNHNKNKYGLKVFKP